MNNFSVEFLYGNTGFPCGTCSNENVFGGFKLYDKTYGPEDSITLRALSIASARMISGQYLTVVPDVKAGDKKVMYRDDLDINVKSIANGGHNGDRCGTFDPSGKWQPITDKFLCVNYLEVNSSICYKELTGTFRSSLLSAGALVNENDDALNDVLIRKIISKFNQLIDRHIFMGDFKSADDSVTHFDGFVKQTHLAGQTINAQTYEVTISGLEEGDCIEGFIGGANVNVPFNTDLATTIADLQANITTYCVATNATPLFTVTFDGVDKLTLVSNYMKSDLKVTLKSTDCNGLGDCYVSGKGMVTVEETCTFLAQDRPIMIPHCPITTANVFQQMNALFLAARSENPDLLSQNDFYLHVSPHVYGTLISAQAIQSGNVNTSTTNLTPFGIRVVEQPGLANGGDNVMFGSLRRNLFFGTDLLSDLTNTETWYEKKCQEYYFRHAVTAGVGIDRFSDTVSNLACFNAKWQPAQNCGGSVLDPCADASVVK